MATSSLFTFTVKDATTIRDDILRTIRMGLLQAGATDPNVTPGSDWYVMATAVGNELAVVGANAIIKADEQMPDTATDDDLARQAGIYNLAKQPATGSVGNVTITSSATSPIPTGQQLVDSAGLRYRVTTGGLYADGASVPIEAVDTGSKTNHAAADILRWQVAPPFCDEKVTVDTGGLINGVDAEDDEGLRARLLAVLQNPPGSGNWEHVAEIAEASSAHVQKAFVYPAIQGPATLHVIVTAAPTSSNKSRRVANTVLTGTVRPYVQGKLPEHAYSVVDTPTDNAVDVAFGLSLPEAPTASPPGPGGGWTNGTPWPAPDNVTFFVCTVTAVTNDASFTVDAQTPPTDGVTRIAFLSPVDFTLYTALVTSHTGTAGAYAIVVDRPFTGVAVGNYIWPEAQNVKTYVDAALAAFALMGPGEKTGAGGAFQRGFRHPPPATSWTYALGPQLLRPIEQSSDEVLQCIYMHRFDSNTLATVDGTAGSMSPQAGPSLTTAPRQYIPRNLAFYRIP